MFRKSIFGVSPPNALLSRKVPLVWMGGQRAIPGNCNIPYVWKPLGAADIPFTYTNWSPGMPNCLHADENCAVIAVPPHLYYLWEDSGCNDDLCSICQF